MKELRVVMIAAVLAVALVFPMSVFAADPVDGAPAEALVIFGAGPAPSHELSPNEVTINKGGTVAFQVAGGGHRIAMYPVHISTTREDIEEDLFPNCVALAPGDADGLCDATSQYLVTDGQGKLIIDTGTNPPDAVVDDPTDRLLFLTGFNNGVLTAGTTVEYRFEKTGRYLVICANRGHFILTPFMFGFVNVVGGDLD